MNIYGIIILSALIIDYAIDIITDILNIKAMKTDIPDEFEGVYDPDTYKKSQEYTKVRTKFGLIESTFDLTVLLIFWFSGGFNYLDTIVKGWELHPVWTGLTYIAVLILIKTVLGLPFSIYSTFVIEERFEFNKTTPKTFITDMLKGLMLAVLIGGPLLAGVLAFFQFAGNLAWLYCWLVTIVFTLFIQFIAPTWIMPLFNKFTPIEDGELKDSIFKYAGSVKFPLTGLFVMDGSKRSTKSNAFFTGFGKNKRIALFDTLIERHTVKELVSVIAHEVGHYKKKHILKGIVISIAHTGIVFYLLSIFLSHEGLFNAFYMDSLAIYTGLIFFGMLYSPIEMFLSIFMHIFSRRNEYEADNFAVTTTGDGGEPMIDALKKLSKHNLSNLTPHPLNVFLNYSHPPVLQRIGIIRKIK
ncbi:M48 family metallopeptidase [candidate division KSB1 bacterium]